MKLQVKAISLLSSQGNRPVQEDFALVHQERGIFVVADGFGGPAGGAQVSKIACEAVRDFLMKEAGDLDATMPFILRSYISLAGNVLFNALIHANRKAIQYNRKKGVHERGGASVLAAFMDEDLVAVANIGNCSAQLYREGSLCELVLPRSYGRLQNPFAPGIDSPPLTAVGITDDLEPEITEYKVRTGDWLLLKSDGLSDSVGEKICEIQKNSKLNSTPPGESAALCLQIFEEAKSDDNLTATLVQF